MGKFHREYAASLRTGAKRGRVTEHFGKRHFGTDNLRAATGIHTFDPTTAGVQHTHYITHVLFRNSYFNFHNRLKQNRITFVLGRFERHGTGDFKRHFTGVDIVVGTVDDRRLHVHYREAGKNTVLHRFFDTLLCRTDIFSRYGAADDFAVELVACTWLQRFEFNPDVTVLTAAAGLTYEFAFNARWRSERFAVSNLRFTHVRLNFEFTAHPVDDDIEVKLTHTFKDRLAGFFIRISAKRRVFFRQLAKSNAQFILVGFCLRLNGDLDNRIRKVHRLKNNRALLITQCITRARIFQTYGRRNVTSVYFVDLLTVVCVHLQDTADPFAFAFSRVQHVRTGLQNTGVYAEERQLTHVRVGHDFKCQRRERFFVGRMAFHFRTVFQVTLNVRYINRCRQIIDNGVQHQLNPFVPIGRSANDRENFHFANAFAQCGFQFFNGDFLAFEVFHRQVFIQLGNFLDQFRAEFFYFIGKIRRDLGLFDVLTQIVFIDVGFLRDDVDDPDKIIFRTDRQLNSNCVRLQTIAHIIYNVQVVRTDNIHFVDVGDPRNAVTVSLSPDGFGLRLNAFFCTEYPYSPVQYTKGTFDFNGEVDVSRGINDIYAVTFPLSGGRSGRNRDSALLLLLHPVHRCSTLVNFPDFVRTACVEQDPFRRGCLTGVNMRHDPDVTCIFQGELSCHESVSLQNRSFELRAKSYQR
ncbi:hypothetical protein DJ90_5581 [Paenibacillus macerans]|uniref:Uncharacterized protein n=1 Tax=Paenibacillus macerans TaxID=44252 RepID=A0A090XUV5_PAEMA|nr:hypothetical protein DJ90_5581 [Paenibacillus macerans]